MKKINNYKDFINNSVNEEEGWKEKAIAASMVAGSLIPGQLKAGDDNKLDSDKQATEISYEAPDKDQGSSIDWRPWPKKTNTMHKKVKTKAEADALLSKDKGWSLDSSKVDTLWREVKTQKPETTVNIDEIRFDDNQYFASGKYNLNEDMSDSISSVIDDIREKLGIITGIQVESSTDKQGLSIRLQNELKGLGYSGDNKGLSKARCEQITKHLESLGIDSSLITSNQLVEGGKETIDASARYVIVKIVYLDKEVISTPGIVDKIPELKEIYYLSKEFTGKYPTVKKNHKKIKHDVKYKKTKIKKCSNITKCFYF